MYPYYPADFDAATEYLSRRDRKSFPKGRFGSGNKFHLDESEKCKCSECAWVREPSWAHPYSELKHACTMGHVANLFGVIDLDVAAAAKVLDHWSDLKAAAATDDPLAHLKSKRLGRVEVPVLAAALRLGRSKLTADETLRVVRAVGSKTLVQEFESEFCSVAAAA